jgi:hypothetical protein
LRAGSRRWSPKTDIISSGVLPVVRLTEVFRQAAQNRIITTAHIHDATCGATAGQTIILCHLHLMPRRPSLGPPLCRNSTLAQDQHFDRKIDKANLGARPT